MIPATLRMSDLRDFQRCPRRFMYSKVRGWKPKTAPETWGLGTTIHEGLAAGYRALHINGAPAPNFLSAAQGAILKTVTCGEDVEKEVLCANVLAYYWDQVGQHDTFDEILQVEEKITVPLYTRLYPDVNNPWSISCTFDLVTRIDGRLTIFDHKTVGTIPETLQFLPLDTQVLTYLWAASQVYNEPVEFVYNLIRRAVPHELTKTGRKSTASKDPEDYLRRVRIWKSPEELQAFGRELTCIVRSMHDADIGTWHRSPIKNGGDACSFCPYWSVCGAELAGHEIDENTAKMLYDIEEVPA